MSVVVLLFNVVAVPVYVGGVVWCRFGVVCFVVVTWRSLSCCFVFFLDFVVAAAAAVVGGGMLVFNLGRFPRHLLLFVSLLLLLSLLVVVLWH